MNEDSCKFIVGFITQKTCGETQIIGYCTSCGIPFCQRHGLVTDEGKFCRRCLARKHTDEGTIRLDQVPTYEADSSEFEDTYWDNLS